MGNPCLKFGDYVKVVYRDNSGVIEGRIRKLRVISIKGKKHQWGQLDSGWCFDTRDSVTPLSEEKIEHIKGMKKLSYPYN